MEDFVSVVSQRGSIVVYIQYDLNCEIEIDGDFLSK